MNLLKKPCGYLLFLLLILIVCEDTLAQSLDLTVKGYGLSIGNSARVNGIRINVRDTRLEKVNGLNVTFWKPKEPATGTVNGLSIGILPGAEHLNGLSLGIGIEGRRTISGIAVGVLGLGAGERISGLAIGGLGLGAGGNIEGIAIGGLGLGAGGNIEGIAIGGLGLGSGGSLTGIMLGGLGVGSGNDIKGLAFSGIGVGSGKNMQGIAVGGIGVGAGENLTGFSAALIGVGAGRDLTGWTVAGIGIGAGRTITGVSIAGIGIGARSYHGVAIAATIGSLDFKGLAIAPAYFRIQPEGTFTGLSISAFNHIRGDQHGVTIGIFNFANRLSGLQLGVLNYNKSNPKWLRLLPVFNANFR